MCIQACCTASWRWHGSSSACRGAAGGLEHAVTATASLESLVLRGGGESSVLVRRSFSIWWWCAFWARSAPLRAWRLRFLVAARQQVPLEDVRDLNLPDAVRLKSLLRAGVSLDLRAWLLPRNRGGSLMPQRASKGQAAFGPKQQGMRLAVLGRVPRTPRTCEGRSGSALATSSASSRSSHPRRRRDSRPRRDHRRRRHRPPRAGRCRPAGPSSERQRRAGRPRPGPCAPPAPCAPRPAWAR